MSQHLTYFQPFVFIYMPIRNPRVSVYLSKQPRLNFMAFISVLFFFGRSEWQSCRKVENVCFFYQQAHAPTGALHFSEEQGTRALWTIWELKSTKSKMARGRQRAWLVFLSFFIYFARLVAIIGGPNRKNCRRYRFKKRNFRNACGNGLR